MGNLAYRDRASNLEMIARYGFVIPENPTGVFLPFDFNAAFRNVDDADTDFLRMDEADPEYCDSSLRSPRLKRGSPLLLEDDVVGCLNRRLYRYYERHYTEIDVLTN